MKSILKRVLEWFGKPQLVEFDYPDEKGMHHGRCYVRHAFGGQEQVRRMLTACGYTNIHIV